MSAVQDGPASAGDLGTPAGAGPQWVPLTPALVEDDGERPVSVRRTVLQVAVGVLLVLVLVAMSGSVAARTLAEKESVNDAAKTANLFAETVVQPALSDGVVTGDPQALDRIDRVVRAYVLQSAIVRVKLWTPNGRVVYSDEQSLIGQQFRLDEEQLEVFTTPRTRAEVSGLDRPENGFERGQGKLLEVYRPVWTPSGTPLLFETYAPYDQVTSRSGQIWRGFAGITLTSLVALLVLLLPVTWRLLDAVRRSREQREALLQRAVDASTDERRRIAGTLHDGVVQELAATSFAVSSAANRAEQVGQPALAEALRAAAGTVRTTIGGLRSLLVDIYPPNLASAGLSAALDDLAATVRLRETEVDLVVDDDAVALLDEAAQRLCYRVTQECLLNTVRHGRAQQVRVRVQRDGRHVVLAIEDDGVGFDVPETLDRPPEGHFGLRVLADRVRDAGAELFVASAPGEGTRWRLEVPVR
ncbi:MAG TPA: ATP-binding protein [Nocardioidaceae bacterium]|nr:ATP-binding protein [Nocardioidaceae bacterium]